MTKAPGGEREKDLLCVSRPLELSQQTGRGVVVKG